MNFKKSLKIALAKKGMKQIDLAQEVKVTGQTVTNWIRNNSISLEYLDKVCKALDMPVSEFVALGED